MAPEKAFVGEFKEILENFIKQKRSLGYKCDAIQSSLRRFSEYSLNYSIKNKSLSKELVLEWTSKRKNESISTWIHRASDLRQFAFYLQRQGYDAFIPPKSHKVNHVKYIPYIFTHEEIDQFFQAVDSIKPHPRSNKHKTFPLLFRLLYCCGLRVSEAIHLKISDIDFDNGVLFIRETKFNKDRLVPMSVPLAELFTKFHALFNINQCPKDYFFRNRDGTQLTSRWIYMVYRKLLWKGGISHGGRGKGPRVHDFRHSFCVHTLAKQVNEGFDLYIVLPVLSVYIGHSSVGATQRYVRLTVEAFPEFLEKVSLTCAYVIPEV